MNWLRRHGGPDAQGVPAFDFSTNSNACGPCPSALQALAQADVSRYPDPAYTELRARLAAFHQVAPGRIVFAASASEFIHRISAWVARQGQPGVFIPAHAYGDYACAAQAWGLARTDALDAAALVWACEPSSPLGQAQVDWPQWLLEPNPANCSAPQPTVVLDLAYAPLRLGGAPNLTPAQRDRVWQLYSPNKALGLTGVRGAYAIAPQRAADQVQALEDLAPSWLLGAHAVAMLQAWVSPEVQTWVAQSLSLLRGWKARQLALLQEAGWQTLPSDANFFAPRHLRGAIWQRSWFACVPKASSCGMQILLGLQVSRGSACRHQRRRTRCVWRSVCQNDVHLQGVRHAL